MNAKSLIEEVQRLRVSSVICMIIGRSEERSRRVRSIHDLLSKEQRWLAGHDVDGQGTEDSQKGRVWDLWIAEDHDCATRFLGRLLIGITLCIVEPIRVHVTCDVRELEASIGFR